jgi:Calx-beta domain/Domain of unknown function (DUF4214)
MSNSPSGAKIQRSNCRSLAARVTAIAAMLICMLASVQSEARAQTGSPNLVVSQVYTRGGEPGASYQSDFVEIFNRGTTAVSLNNYALQATLDNGSIPTSLSLRIFSLNGASVQPGHYFLIRFRGDAAGDGQPLPTPDFDLNILPAAVPANLHPTAGTIVLLTPDGSFQGCPSSAQAAGVVDFVGYGNSLCYEGPSGPAPLPTLNQAAQRELGGCADNNVNALDFHLGPPLPRNSSSSPGLCSGAVVSSLFNFAAPQFDAHEGEDHAQITVTRTGDTSVPASVEYVITGGTANERSDYTTTSGRLRFEPGETQKTFDILLTDDATQEQSETIEMMIWKPEGAGAIMGFRDRATLVIHDNDFSAGPNPIEPVESSAFFVRQHYHDFLNREPDASGFNFWINNIESCGANAGCREVKRVDTSAAFFLSIEFQHTGFFVYKLYRASLPAASGRARSMPRYAEFVRDTQEVGRGVVVNQAGWEQQLESNSAAFVDEFVTRADFKAAYPSSLTPAEYVDKLNAQAGGALSKDERDLQVALLTAGLVTRAQVLRKVAESGAFTSREINSAFVLMQYFGYLRRAPNDPPDADFAGFDFWLQKLDTFGGDYRRAEMVKAFLASDEYRARFAAPLP